MKEHEIVKRKKVEKEYVEAEENRSFPRLLEPLFRRKKVVNEYEQFRCNVKHKMATLESWDFDFCPFCGKGVFNEKVEK